jgi:hypothetical protein
MPRTPRALRNSRNKPKAAISTRTTTLSPPAYARRGEILASHYPRPGKPHLRFKTRKQRLFILSANGVAGANKVAGVSVLPGNSKLASHLVDDGGGHTNIL